MRVNVVQAWNEGIPQLLVAARPAPAGRRDGPPEKTRRAELDDGEGDVHIGEVQGAMRFGGAGRLCFAPGAGGDACGTLERGAEVDDVGDGIVQATVFRPVGT